MSERYRTLRDLFESCLEHQNPAAFLADHCFDPTVWQEVEALLSAYSQESSLLDSPLRAQIEQDLAEFKKGLH